jgi:FkbM family methyltransferase
LSASLQSIVSTLLTRTPLGLWPVRVRCGLAQGARWTFFPWTSYWRGTHEPALQSVLGQLGGGDLRGWTCWDLGAHFGLYSIGLARRVGATGEVAAFEPNPISFARLERHQRMNRVPWLKLYCAAVSDHCAGSELFTYGNLGTTTTHLPYDGELRGSQVRAIPVRTVRLDDLVTRGELRPPRLVKIDVEGHGQHALAGMRETLRSARPIIIAGFHSPQEIQGMMAALTSLGYRWRRIAESTDNPEVQVGHDYLFTPPVR